MADLDDGSRAGADSDDRPVGVFDSGVGGISILREIRRQLPLEDVVYFADTANCPYGSKTKDELRALTSSIARFLLDRGAKLIVVACNTASVAALSALRATFPVPFVGVVPAVKPAALMSRRHSVAVLATPATFQGEMFADLVETFAADVHVVRQVCPGLVEMVERGETDGPAVEGMLAEYLRPAMAASVDAVVLGCTHYPFLRPVVERIVGPEVHVVDSGDAVARQVGRVLDAHGLRSRRASRGRVTFYTSSPDAERLRPVFRRLSGEEDAPVLSAREVEQSRR